jgi:hypothetical protein
MKRSGMNKLKGDWEMTPDEIRTEVARIARDEDISLEGASTRFFLGWPREELIAYLAASVAYGGVAGARIQARLAERADEGQTDG